MVKRTEQRLMPLFHHQIARILTVTCCPVGPLLFGQTESALPGFHGVVRCARAVWPVLVVLKQAKLMLGMMEMLQPLRMLNESN